MSEQFMYVQAKELYTLNKGLNPIEAASKNYSTVESTSLCEQAQNRQQFSLF